MARIDSLNKVEDDDEAARIAQGKAGFGAVVRCGIGDEPLKTYGDKGFMSKVVTGEEVPKYLAVLYMNTDARRRMGVELLKSVGIRFRTVAEWDGE